MHWVSALRSLLVLVMGLGLGFIAYKKWSADNKLLSSSRAETHADVIKKHLLKYKKPARVEVTNYVRDPRNKFQKEIQNIRTVKTPLDPQSLFYIEVQLFTDEADPQAPLVAQFRFLSVENNNLIREESLNLE